ncbi:S-adenosyl-L-methionine-dependent methyltransferase [Multifurca ochricompacta]|uniref:S-adenosyl-L-methionine-dependent methyltransferase n=1 Tax=Multifurca ochricompacta TaxID=376703 RepID=A0AAD4QMU6_9AGAM|nr:S-adenosyl-L-methionine-dependent methyltransferase [Multifurca ochricompacta]
MQVTVTKMKFNPDSDDLRVLRQSDMENEKFEEYYRKQLSIDDDDEWLRFLGSCREPLPSTFRISGTRQTAAVLTSVMEKTYIPHLSGVIFEDQPIPPPMPLQWYPKGLAWQLNVPKKALRKSPEFKKFHSFLVFETEVGNITRQEAVSMLPPLFLDVEPHHVVLDMCAAPGSKTSQLLESLHSSQSLLDSCVPPGVLIANDSDYKRAQLLIHQTARIPSPVFVVTNVDASIFPTLSLPPESTTNSSGRKVRPAPLLFDRILCDVPCSGDGTIRKNVGIWKKWNPMDGNGLHGLQLRILQRAMRMLRWGGKIVYSTCSLNPVENEAVIAEALRTVPGFELLDVSESLPSLIRRPGLTKWLPTASRDLQSYETYEHYLTSLPGGKGTARLVQSHWPPSEDLCLERCIRIYPHLQDTGGFFIAVLQHKPSTASLDRREGKRVAEEVEVTDVKKARLDGNGDVSMTSTTELPESKIEPPNLTPTETTPAVQKHTQRQRHKQTSAGDGGFKEMPYTFISPNDPTVESCMQLSLTSDFPSSNLLVRNPAGEPARSLYLTNDLVRAIVSANEYKRIRLMTAGTKIFTRQEGGSGRGGEDSTEKASRFRLLSEGLPVVLPYIKPESIVDANLSELRRLLETYYPLLSAFGEEFRYDIGSKLVGSHVVRFKAGDIDGATLTHDLVLPIWKSTSSISLMIDKKAKSALSLRVFGEDLTVAGRQAAAAKQKKSKSNEGVVQDTIVPEIETEGAESGPDQESGKEDLGLTAGGL